MAIPFEGTTIGADGKRYANDDPDIPTDATAAPGKHVTNAALAPTIAQLDALDAEASPTRTITDAVLVEDDKTMTSVMANFTDADLGADLTGLVDGIPDGTVIESINSESSVEMSNAATESATSVDIVITQHLDAVLDDIQARLAVLEA